MGCPVSRREAREEAAHRYADAGWRVFPAEPGGKRPATRHGFHDGTTDHRRIEQWWRSEPRFNLGIATGAPGPDVVDVDVRTSGNGYGPLRQLKQAGLVPKPMAIVRTPSTGAHLYYQGTAQQSGHLDKLHLDFRSQGGYVVASPSRIARRDYEVVKSQPSDATFDWDAARQLLVPPPQRQAYRAPERGDGRPKDLSHLAEWVAQQPEGNRNAGLFWASCRAAEAGDATTLGSLANAARAAGLDDREIDRTIASAQRTATAGASTRPFEHQAPQQAVAAAPQIDQQMEAGS